MTKSKLTASLLILIFTVISIGITPTRSTYAATFTVTTTGDTNDNNLGDNVCVATGGGCTLRAAIQQANATAGADTIAFAIPPAGVQTISPGSALPTITDTVTIDGTTQGGWVGQSPVVVLNGTNVGGTTTGLTIAATAPNSVIRGLNIRNWTGHGISLGSTGNTLTYNHIGTNQAGTADNGNAGHGVVVSANNNIIGGTDVNSRNVISGNNQSGVVVLNASGNLIRNNFLGTNRDATGSIPNSTDGILIFNSASNTLTSNIVSGNTGNGINISGGGSNVINGYSLIGLGINGFTDIGNGNHGVYIENSANNLVGQPPTINVISGNGGSGVYINGASATGNYVQGNYIGLRNNGQAAVPNNGTGVSIINATSNFVGGITNPEANSICGNGGSGVFIQGGGSNMVRGNNIGLNFLGGAQGNGSHGIHITGSSNNQIGIARGNGIIFNNGHGIYNTASNGTVIESNTIGADAAGTTPQPNALSGIFVENSSNLTIGGDVSGEDNEIAGNPQYGIYVLGGSGVGILANEVGIDGTVQVDVGNGLSGVRLENTTGAVLANVNSSGNGGHGLEIIGGGNHIIRASVFGANLQTTTPVPNNLDGINILNSSNNQIGTATLGTGNIISGNLASGVTIAGATSTNNVLQLNLIGVNISATQAVPNGAYGVYINGSSNNVVGPSIAGLNYISSNGAGGVYVLSGTGNIIRSHVWANGGRGIDLDQDGFGPFDGPTPNDPLDADGGANNLQNTPILTSAFGSVNGIIRSTPNTAFNIDFFYSASCDAAGYGEGQQYFNTLTVNTDGTGFASFSSGTPAVPAGSVYTAIATGPSGTSEYSPCLRPNTTNTDALTLFNPSNRNVSQINTLQDLPPAGAYNTFASGAPTAANGGQWVMGDWNGDGLDTPAVYATNGVFYWTNNAGSSGSWNGMWFGLIGRPAVAGRFGPSNNDCVGVVDSSNYPGFGTAFALYYTCSMVDGNPPKTFQWLSVLLPDSQGFTGTHQFTAGDYNGDGIDSIACRRGPYIAFSNTPPSTMGAAFPLAQYIGAPSTGNSNVVTGDWNGDVIDSFGLFYENGNFYYRNDLDWNTGAYLLQRVGQPIGTPVTAWVWYPLFGGSQGAAGGEEDTFVAALPDPATLLTEVILPASVIEAEDTRVTPTGDWATQSASAASGEHYVYVTPTPSTDAALTLAFTGTSAEVIYVAGPQMGSFTILVDDVAVRTIIAYADETAFDQRTVVNYLDDGPHTLKIVAVDGRSAIDAFVVGGIQP